MYINDITLENVRTFAAQKTIHFNHPDRVYSEGGPIPISPRLTNVNLLFGPNACGKSTVLESIALASLGPAVIESRIAPRPLVRFLPATRAPSPREGRKKAVIRASMVLHGDELQAMPPGVDVTSELTVVSHGELERFEPSGSKWAKWDALYYSENESFFVVAYGATRRVESQGEKSWLSYHRTKFMRLNRVESIIQEGFPLVSLRDWLPDYKKGSHRFDNVIKLINKALGKGHFVFEGKAKGDDYCFSQGGLDIPFRSLSDGYRAYLGWVEDLLFHLDFASMRSKRQLDELPGIVLVDEIDLHLHPKWQMEVIGNLSRAFPRLQFIFTSHSPLIAGSVEWMNVTRLHLDKQHRTGVDAFTHPIHGLDADQILVSDLFDLKTTRAPGKVSELEELQKRARHGDKEAADRIILAMAQGTEASK